MNKVVVCKSKILGSVNAVSSKSHAHRVLICSAFSDNQTVVKGLELCDDVQATINCLNSLGAKIERIEGNNFLVTPVFRAKNAVLDCNECGATLRFMLAIVSAVGGEFSLIRKNGLVLRPNEILINQLTCNGVMINEKSESISVKGKLEKYDFCIQGGVSSQYISALLLCAPIARERVRIKVEGEILSSAYVDLTIEVMASFGVTVLRDGNTFTVEKGQAYVSPKEIEIEGDWSNSTFHMALGLLCGRTEVLGLNSKSLQADKSFLSAVKQMGANIILEKDAYIAKKKQLNGADFNVEQMIDIAPILIILASFAKGESNFNGVDRLKIKESDRLSAIIDMVDAIGAKASYKDGVLTVIGNPYALGGTVDAKNDHRLIMSAVVAGAYTGGVTILNANGVEKSYSRFFDDFTKLGGIYNV